MAWRQMGVHLGDDQIALLFLGWGPMDSALQDKASSQFVARSDELVRQMGYQFRLTEVRLPQKAKTGQNVKNHHPWH